ncbi:hypothetical protein PMIN03_010040 [Paraphaeosphaeria minitans]|uniref:RING-finger domain containing protein n=1 Tax=Paraphaeosphaeria minitans TaxID=565426 RepID=A0A9P6GF57_9PLEO|nr:RING-finger domain containing protein [Paraphaeosphaeria minitans]
MAAPNKAIFLRDQMHIMRSYPRTCSICTHRFDEENSFKNIHSPVRLQVCGHVFGMKCIVDWANNRDKDDHNQCPFCGKRLFIKEDQQPSPSDTERSSRTRYSSRHENEGPRSRYGGSPRYAARTETIGDGASTARISRHDGRSENAESSRMPSGAQVGSRSIEISISRRTSRCEGLAPAWERNTPRVDPRSFDTYSQQQASRRENVLPFGAYNVPWGNQDHNQPPAYRFRNVSQGNPGYYTPARPTVQTTAPSTHNWDITPPSQGPPLPSDECESRRAGWSTSTSGSQDTWTS